MQLFQASRVVWRAVPLVLAVAMLTACDDDPFSPYWDRGTYYLSYANNRPVPTVVSGGTEIRLKLEAIEGNTPRWSLVPAVSAEDVITLGGQ